jgi:uncharacterized protein YidB (DUF937 family)
MRRDVMEPLSAGLGVVVATLLAKAWERVSDRTVDGAEGVVTRLVERVRRRFADQNDQDGSKALATLEAAPDSPRALAALADAVDRHAALDAAWGEALGELVDEARQAGFVAGPASQVAWGSSNAQVQNTQGSNITIEQSGIERST